MVILHTRISLLAPPSPRRPSDARHRGRRHHHCSRPAPPARSLVVEVVFRVHNPARQIPPSGQYGQLQAGMSLQRGINYVWANATKQECISFNHHAISYHSGHKKKEIKSDSKALHGRERTQILKFGLRIVGEIEKNARNPVFQNAKGWTMSLGTNYLYATFLAMFGSLLGIAWSIPLRRALVIELRPPLKFPEGVTTADCSNQGRSTVAVPPKLSAWEPLLEPRCPFSRTWASGRAISPLGGFIKTCTPACLQLLQPPLCWALDTLLA